MQAVDVAMSNRQLDIWRSIEQFREHRAAWDDLWLRSTVVSPAARSGPLMAWLEHFAASGWIQVFAVRRGQDLVGALPLVSSRYRGVLPVAGLPRNSWCYAGELLLEPHDENTAACELILDACRATRMPLLRLENIPLSAPHWRTFLAVLDKQQTRLTRKHTFTVGTIEVGGDWEAFQNRCSRNHRKKMKRRGRRLQRIGDVEFNVYDRLAVEEVAPLLHRGFKVEHRSWKGAARSSVLAAEGLFDFFCLQAEALAAQGHLCLSFLSCGGEPIAFEYGWLAKNTYFSCKVGYDDRFARYSPGNVLLWRLLEYFHGVAQVDRIDLVGPLTESTQHLATGCYPVGHVTAASGRKGLVTGGVLGLLSLSARRSECELPSGLDATLTAGP